MNTTTRKTAVSAPPLASLRAWVKAKVRAGVRYAEGTSDLPDLPMSAQQRVDRDFDRALAQRVLARHEAGFDLPPSMLKKARGVVGSAA